MVRPVLALAGFVCGLACFGVVASALPWRAVEVEAATPRAVRTAQGAGPLSVPVPVQEPVRQHGAAADARREEPIEPVAQGSLQAHVAFRDRLVAGSALVRAPFTREELTRTFSARDDGSAGPGALTAFLDLDRDGREEGLVVIGDGWWGQHFDLCHFVPGAGGFVLAAHQRFDHATRGTPLVRLLAAPRAGFLALPCHDGWGTGYQTTCMRVVEAVGASLVEVASIPYSGEILCGGAGPVLEYGCNRAEVVPSGAGSALLLVAGYDIDFTTEGFGPEMDTVTVEFEARWAQGAPGGAFLLAQSGGFPSVDSDVFWCLGARAWLTRHAAAVRGIARPDEAQLRQLHRTCDLAEECGPCPEAAAVRAAIPPLPVR